MYMWCNSMMGGRTIVFIVGLFVLECVRADGIINSMSAFGSASGGDPAIMPRFLSRGTTFQVVTGESVVLPCEIQNLGTFVVIWRRGSSILSAGRLLVTRDQRFSLQGQHDLQLNAVRVEDQGDYTCQIGDGTPGDLIHTLEILMPPTLQVSPPTGQITARKGGSVTFECKATGNPVPTIHWSKKGGSLPSGLLVENGYLLTLNDVQRQHAGSYQCTATNGIGQPVSADVHLHVLYPPEVSVLRSWVNSGEGLEAKLDCIVHADPPAEVLWYQDSFLLQPTDRRIMSSSGKTHTLTIKNIQLSDFGNYSCVVVNSIGKDKRYIELSGKPGPALVVSSGYSNPTEYDLRWTVQSVFPIIEVRILYRRVLINSSYQHPGKWHDIIVRPQQTHHITSTGERTHRYKLTDLVADSVYECLIQSRNQNGWGELSDIHQWFTSQRGHKPPATISMATSAYKHTYISIILLIFLSIFV